MANSILEIIQHITSSRRQFAQGQILSWEERRDLITRLRDSLRAERERWIAAEAAGSGCSRALVERWSVGAALAECDRALAFAPPVPNLRPLGVISILNPFGLGFRNAFARLVPAVLAGNRVVLKASTHDRAVVDFLNELRAREPRWADALYATAEGSATVGEILVAHPGLQGVSYWGAPARVEKVFSALRLSCHRQWSMGGTSVAIVLDEEGLARGFPHIVASVTEGMGTLPWNLSRVIVAETLEQEFFRRIAAAGAALRVPYPVKLDADELESRLARIRAQKGEVLGEGPGVRFVKGFSLCSELRFEGGGFPIVFVDTIKYAHEAGKKISAMERVWSAQVWGEEAKAARLGAKLEAPIVALNKGFPEMDPALWNADPAVSGGCQDLRFDGAFFSRHQSIDGPTEAVGY